MALSLYRKYRPEVFADVVGQEHVEKTLINAISEGAVAHAYLFCGPRGTGKTTSARLLAKALLCESAQNGQPDGACPQCLEIAQGTHPDVFELDAASRTGVDNVREEIIGRVGFAPTRGRFKVYIIDEVHMLSTAAFNALLKTLEEPPEHVVFVLCTTDPHKVPETIQSRCQRFDFRRFSVEEIVGYLERISKGEGFEYEPEALEFIAAKSAGGMRDATTALEQVGVYTEGKITLDEATRMFGQIDIAALFEIAGYIARRDTPSCFVWINDLVGRGVDLAQFARDNGLSGLEFASGIPGSVGGGVLMNAGAYGGEMKDVVESVVVYYVPTQALTEVRGEDCGFEYRRSGFEKINCAIMGAVFKLTPDDPEAIGARMKEMNEKRTASQPLDMPSAGSAFKRPVGGYAAALIDRCGLKGYTVGGAQISRKHAGFAVNTGSATYDDVVALLDHVRREVYEQTQVTLEPEIRIYPKGMMLVDDWRERKQTIIDGMLEQAKQNAADSAAESRDVRPS